MSFDSTIHAKAVELTKLTYEITAAAGSGHPTSGASLAACGWVVVGEIVADTQTLSIQE